MNAIDATDMTASDNTGRVFFTTYHATREAAPWYTVENTQDDAAATAFGTVERLRHAVDRATDDA